MSPSHGVNIESTSDIFNFSSQSTTEIHYQNKDFDTAESRTHDIAHLYGQSDILFLADEQPHTSELSLVPEERNKLERLMAYQSVPKERQFVLKILYDLIDSMELPESPPEPSPLSLSSSSSMVLPTKAATIARQYGQETISSKSPVVNVDNTQQFESLNTQEAEQVAKELKRHLQERLYKQLIELSITTDHTSPSTSKKRGHIAFESAMNITSEMRRTLEDKLARGLKYADQEEDDTVELKKKSNLKNIGIQTGKQKKYAKKHSQKVTISEPKSIYIDSEPSSLESLSKDKEDTEDKDTQTNPKEKQD